MIAPRKKKLIKLFLMAWSVVLVITGSALSVFASSTDDGSSFPDSFVARWVIYNVDTGVTETVDVTSNVTSSGLDFYFPYNTGGVSQIGLFLFPSSSFSFFDFYVSGTVYYDFPSSYEPVTFRSNCTLAVSDTASPSSVGGFYDILSTFSDNPFVLSGSGGYYDITAVRFAFNVSQVSGHFWIHFDFISFDSVDIRNKIFVSQLEDSTETLDDSVEALETALPLPTFDASAFASAEAIADDYTFFNDGLRFTFMESDLVTHIFILVVYFTCLSIAIFGHAGG